MKESHRTRSRAAPDWTVEESLILVNEMSAVESEWGASLPSFQKWQQIVENCNALDVNRNLNQCKRKWDALLTAYRQKDRSFPVELFTAVDKCVTTKEKSNEVEADDDLAEEEQVAMETDRDSDPAAQAQSFFEIGCKKQRPRMKRQKRRDETRNPWGYFTSTTTNHQEPISLHEKVKGTDVVAQMNAESEEQTMARMLWENAVQINAILEGNVADDLDYKLADLKNAESVEIDLTRRKGDKLIDCLEKVSATLNQLCDRVQKYN